MLARECGTMDLPDGLRIFDLTGKVALVTGGGRGLGRTMAVALASAGADLVLVGRTAVDLEDAATAITGMGREALTVTADVTRPEQVEAMVAATLSGFGRIDILVNNAGMNIRKSVIDYGIDDWDEIIGLNLRGYFLVARAVGRHMVERRYGRVINVTSILAAIGLPNQGGYASSKGAITQLSKVMAIEWAPYNVTVNCLGPTYFETDMTRPLYQDPERKTFIESRTPMGRWGQPDELAGAVIFLASDASGFITGQTLFVDGGWLAW
jgi:NAD(P)-dependent dehydrogenase (short-subunit alcohol dehydrogenase family)